MVTKSKRAVVLFLCLLFLCSNIAIAKSSDKVVLAYIDPGVGAMIIQLLIGTFVGVIYAMKNFRRKLKEFIVRIFSRGKKGEKKDL